MLLDYIGQGRVVPILGPELLVAHEGDKIIPFYHAVTKRLIRHFEMPEINGETLNDFLIRFQATNNPIKLAKSEMLKVLNEMENEEQPALKILANTKVFRLFLTTTPDSLLEETLRGMGQEPEVYFFSTNYRRKSDLPNKKLIGNHCVIYHLYGKSSRFSEYAVSEDDRLMFSCEWMDSNSKPQNLLSYLADKYLLILGCGYENWQARFFLYGLKGTELFNNVFDASSLLVDSHTRNDAQLDRFLSRCRGNIYYEGDAFKFIDELNNHLKTTPVSTTENNGDVFVENSIFISYASEDREYALKIKKKLEEFSLPVWLDQYQLESGDSYDVKIENNIRKSSIFLAILSQTTAKISKPRYFRKEWNIAADEALKRKPKIPFIHPIAIDDVTPSEDFLDAINKVTWTYAPRGELSDANLNHLLDIMEQL